MFQNVKTKIYFFLKNAPKTICVILPLFQKKYIFVFRFWHTYHYLIFVIFFSPIYQESEVTFAHIIQYSITITSWNIEVEKYRELPDSKGAWVKTHSSPSVAIFSGSRKDRNLRFFLFGSLLMVLNFWNSMKNQYHALEPRNIKKYECPNFNDTPGRSWTYSYTPNNRTGTVRFFIIFNEDSISYVLKWA